jgi:pyridoxal biosynthesis lyase PdxS
MTLEELADLIRANSANTNGRIDRVVDHVRDLHGYIDRTHNESNAALMNIQNDLTDVRSGIAEIRRSIDLTPVLSTMQRQIDALSAEVAELKRRAS